MRTLRALLTVLGIVWTLLALLFYLWLRERYGRGGPIPVSQAGTLLNPLRRYVMPVRRSLQRFGLEPGDTVLELGPGPGYYTIEAGRMLGPKGKIVCVDVQPGMIALLRERLDAEGVANAHPVVGDGTKLPLVDSCVDVAFLVTVLGEIPDRVAALRELRRVLKPGGALSFCETLGDPDYVLQATLRDLCRACGFQEVDCSREFLGYTMVFSRT